MAEQTRSKTPGVVFLSLAAVFFAFTLLAAFTIYGELAALLALVCLAVGTILLVRRD